MFKKISTLLFVVIFSVLIGQVNVNAIELDNVKDNLNYLTDSEEKKLQSSIDDIEKEYGLDVVVVITKDTEGKSSMAFADDYFDYNGYGVGRDHSGLLMLINMKEREVWISTTGKAIKIFTDSRISNMVKNVTNHLSKEKYYDACTTFLKDIKTYAKPDNRTYFQKALHMMRNIFVYIAAIVVAIIATVIASLSNKGKTTISSKTYEEQGSFQLSGSADDYIRESTTRTKIEKSSGSSTHRGSSGRSHGGGGGSF